nr:autotransporter-associated N-terminal domain-containing protein [uncultured Leptotrichia sp.]
MTNNLRKVKQDLCSFAKRAKDFKYTDSALFVFLLTGFVMVRNNLFSSTANKDIETQKEEISTSIKNMHQKFKETRKENDKLLKEANLEIIQLMEQGDHVIKSPWSSWQYGINYFYNSWGGTYKGRGDKQAKYPYEGVYKRGEWWERNVSPYGDSYKRLLANSGLHSDPSSSLSNRRNELEYGLVGTVPVPDAGVPFIIEPVVNINTPTLPNLNINPTIIQPNVSFSIPPVKTISFDEIKVNKLEPNVFEPPALNEVSTGFAQGQEIGLNTNQNYIVSNSTVNLIDDVNIKIQDTGYSGTGQFSWDGHSDNRSRTNRPADGGVHGTTSSAYSYVHTPNAIVPSEYSQSTTSPGLGFLDDSITRTDRKFPINTNWRPVTDPNYQRRNASSQQVFLNVLTDGYNLGGAGKTLTFENHTSEPLTNNSNRLERTNTLRVISVNHAYGSVNRTVEFNLEADLKISGRDGYLDKMLTPNPKNSGHSPHMTIGIEHQAYGSIAARAINKGTMTLEKISAKTGGLASNVVGMTAMVEDYGDYGHRLSPDDPNANAGIPNGWYLKDGDSDASPTPVTSPKWKYRRQAPWESTLENRGTIKVDAIDSIGMDFAEYTFRADIAGTSYKSDNISGPIPNPRGNIPAYNNKGSLNIYARVGNIELNSEDPDASVNAVYSGIQGSYGLRVPNIFKTADNSQVYYDETVIDGTLNSPTSKGIVVNGSHNVGVSISKLITGSERVRQYQSGGIPGLTPADGAKPYLVARANTDPIGNIYNLNVVVNGTENVGLLRKSDYMQGNKYDIGGFMPGLARSKNDFVITDSHINSIDFTKDAKGGALFRTDKYGIDLAKTNFTVTAMENRNKDANDNDLYNIVMLANGSINSVVAGAPAEDNLDANKPVKVKNTVAITIGSTANTGYNMLGMMAYKGGEFENDADITLNTKNSIGLVIEGEAERSGVKKESKGESTSSTIKVTGDGSIAVYNNGRTYTMTGGEINISGKKNVGVYAAGVPTYDHLGNITGYSNLATTTLNNGTLKVSGKGSVGLYANGGSDIKLNNMTNMEVEENALLFYGIKHNTDYSQLELVGNNTVTIKNGGYAFYFKNENLLDRLVKTGSTGKIYLTLEDGATLSVIEGDGVTPLLLTNVSPVSANNTGDYEIEPGIVIRGTSGDYTTTKSTKVNLQMDMDANLDDKNDRYLNSEFASSSVTLRAGKTISGSGALTTADVNAEKVKKSKVAIAQTNSEDLRNKVKLTNDGTINLTGTGMAGIVGEFAEIHNNSVLKTTGQDSTAIIGSNGALAQNGAAGTIEIGNGGVGIAGINYLGVTDIPRGTPPTNGNRGIDIVNKGSIKSVGNGAAIGILAVDDESQNIVGAFGPNSILLDSGSSIDVSSGTGGIGVYSQIKNRSTKTGLITDNGSTIKIGTNGVGIYADGTVISATNGGIIETVNGATGKGIYTNESVTSNKTIKLLGDKSIGIHVYGNSPVNITNSGDITVGSSLDKNNPSIAIYGPNAGSINHLGGTITLGNKSLGLYSENGTVTSSAPILVGNEGLGIYKKSGTATLNGKMEVGNSAVGVFGDNNATIVNNSSDMNIGDSSFGFAILGNGVNNYIGNPGSAINLGTESVYLYKAGPLGTLTSETSVNLKAGAGRSTGFYAVNGGAITNRGQVNFANGVGSVGAYSESSGTVYNEGTITVGGSDILQNHYSIGMASKNGGKIVNNAGSTINVTGTYGIGMFADGAGSRAENYGTINLESAGEFRGAYGMYINNHATGYVGPSGVIKSGRYGSNTDKSDLIGIAVLNGATLENHGTIDIDARNSYGIYIRNGIIKNYGTINISGTGSIGLRYKNATDENGNPLNPADIQNAVNLGNGATVYREDPNINNNVGTSAGSTRISPTGVVTINGNIVSVHDLTSEISPLTGNYGFSNVGIYVDTLGRTNPINWVDGFNPSLENDLIIGAEAAELSTSKAIKIGRNVLGPYIAPYMQMTRPAAQTLNAISGSLTWNVKPLAGPSGYPEEAIMAKIPYTDFVLKTENAWNFTDGLEQRYGVEGIGTREKLLFNKLNSIGKNEQSLLTQAFDEMMGHQYGNTQQRISSTGSMLDKEFKHLKKDWRNPSKQNNKIKVFGMRDEYKSDTAGIINYTSNSYGFAYVHEDDTVRLGNSSGWYAGTVTNRFKFKDIGKSKENQTMIKAGVFKTMSPKKDYNGALQWTVGGDVFAGINEMKRRYLVVDEIFQAKSDYHSYGAAVKTDLGYDIRMSERMHLRPYGALKLEYGKFNNIKEDTGEMRLEVKGNDYFSVRPEVGVEFRYVQPLAVRTNLSVGLTASYENELGKVGEVNNKGRVRYTTADWFNIRGEKDDRRGNGKFDLNIGVDNTRFGVTVNGGYDTKGQNVRGGIGFRAIY